MCAKCVVCPPQRWVVSRQMRFEGGFQGRCNKLVDGCYSFWQAGLLPLLHRALFKEGTVSSVIVEAWGQECFLTKFSSWVVKTHQLVHFFSTQNSDHCCFSNPFLPKSPLSLEVRMLFPPCKWATQREFQLLEIYCWLYYFQPETRQFYVSFTHSLSSFAF